MTFSPIFQRQPDRQHLLQSLLITLSFSPQLEAVHIQNIVAGFVQDAQNYVSTQKSRGWLLEQDGVIMPSDKSLRFVRLNKFISSQSKAELSKQTYHDLLLLRTLFLCLLHLNFEDIIEIKKQKYYQLQLIPDLTIVTQNLTLLIEVDRGKQPFSTLEAKIRRLQAIQAGKPAFSVIYFTDSEKTYTYLTQNFKQSTVQCIYLPSPTLAQDLLNLSSAVSKDHPGTVDAEMNFDTGNVHLNGSVARERLGQSFSSRINHFTHQGDANTKVKFQPVELTSPITGKPVKKATTALAPNVFVYDTTLLQQMQEPLPDEFVSQLSKLQAQSTNGNLENIFEDTLTDSLNLLKQDGLAQDNSDLQDIEERGD
jgi:hypothetical protein